MDTFQNLNTFLAAGGGLQLHQKRFLNCYLGEETHVRCGKEGLVTSREVPDDSLVRRSRRFSVSLKLQIQLGISNVVMYLNRNFTPKICLWRLRVIY